MNNQPSREVSLTLRNRIDQAMDRRGENDWLPADQPPAEKTWVTVRSTHENATPLKRVLFNGRYFMTREPFSAWKAVAPDERPVSELVETGSLSVLEGLDVLELEPLDGFDERASLAKLAKMELKIDVVRMFRPGEDAHGALTGKVLATSRHFAAQAVGENNVVIHEQARLGRRVSNGELVTLNYQGGRADVYNGQFVEVNVNAPFLNSEQRGWLRMQMLEAICGVEGTDGAAADDRLIVEALRYALDKTAEMFGLARTNIDAANIRLSITDPASRRQVDEAESAIQRASELELLPMRDRRGG